MKRTLIAAMVGMAGMAGLVTTADAHDSIGFSLSLGGPAYYGPPPVYVAPSPVYVAPESGYYGPPPVVYYTPAPVYYGSSAYYRFDGDARHHEHGSRHGWGNHVRFHDRDDD